MVRSPDLSGNSGVCCFQFQYKFDQYCFILLRDHSYWCSLYYKESWNTQFVQHWVRSSDVFLNWPVSVYGNGRLLLHSYVSSPLSTTLRVQVCLEHVNFFMITFSVASIEFYMNRAKSVFSTIKSIQASSHEIMHFHPPLSWKMRVLL